MKKYTNRSLLETKVERAQREKREAFARLIPTLTTEEALIAAYRKYAGRRAEFSLLGPEYYGCYNSGHRAMIQRHCPYRVLPGSKWRKQHLVTVGFQYDEKSWRDYPANRAGWAWRYFAQCAMQAVAFNLKARGEVREALVVVNDRKADHAERFAATLTLSDYGAMVAP
jgi:hypothetical protein